MLPDACVPTDIDLKSPVRTQTMEMRNKMSNAKEYYEKLNYNVKTYGLQVQHVFGNASGAAFSYSIGLYETYNHPEILIIGLGQELCHTIINNMADDIKNGIQYLPLNFYSNILDDFDCYIVKVDKSNYGEYVVQAEQYYGNSDFPLVQCIYPTITGIFPWENTWPAEARQSILGELNL